MHKFFATAFLLLVPVFLSSVVFAEELSVEGNGSGSSSSIIVNSGSSVNIFQQNSSDLFTDIAASADTGGNSASDNTGGATIQTGDSTVDIKVKNVLNANFNQPSCCGPTPTLIPTSVPDPSRPTPTPAPSPSTSTSSSSSSSDSSSSSSSSSSVGGTSAVLGLSATSSADPAASTITTLGLLCLATALVYLKSALVLL